MICLMLELSCKGFRILEFNFTALCKETDCLSLGGCFPFVRVSIRKISLTSPMVINVPTRTSLAFETKSLLFLWLAHLNNKANVCKQISSQFHCSCYVRPHNLLSTFVHK